MPQIVQRKHWFAVVLFVIATLASIGAATIRQEADEPELRLRATPRVGFAPVEILFIAELRGGSDDYEPLYCASVEWEWDDDTRSEQTPDCDPYEPGTSTIRRRFSQRHTFQRGGNYEVRLSFKKGNETVSSARTTVEVRSGFR